MVPAPSFASNRRGCGYCVIQFAEYVVAKSGVTLSSSKRNANFASHHPLIEPLRCFVVWFHIESSAGKIISVIAKIDTDDLSFCIGAEAFSVSSHKQSRGAAKRWPEASPL